MMLVVSVIASLNDFCIDLEGKIVIEMQDQWDAVTRLQVLFTVDQHQVICAWRELKY